MAKGKQGKRVDAPDDGALDNEQLNSALGADHAPEAAEDEADHASAPEAASPAKVDAPAKAGTVKERRALRQAAKREQLSKGESK